MKILITGAAGFIGYHISKRLLTEGNQIIGIDNLNDYYDLSLKEARLKQLQSINNFLFYKLDIRDCQKIANLFTTIKFDQVIHLGAQVGVHHSSINPLAHGETNLIGYLNILEGCRYNQIKHFLYASSSSVYGLNCKMPFTTSDIVDCPISLYAATKKANELIAHAYAYLYQIPTTGMRFFTVYGPWGRPDMALFKFTKAIFNSEYINVYNFGEIFRDFTFIDDVVEAIVRLRNSFNIENIVSTTLNNSIKAISIPYRIYNIGNNQSINLMDCIKILEDIIGIRAKICLVPMKSGDMLHTEADTKTLYDKINFKPQTSIIEGIKKFVQWYRKYYQI